MSMKMKNTLPRPTQADHEKLLKLEKNENDDDV